jgi:hypothetical protein
MSVPVRLDNIPIPEPGGIDHEYMLRLVKAIDNNFKRMNNAGPLRATTVSITDLPTSATGLKTGDLWNDSGTVKVV